MTRRITRILVPTDFSTSSDAALDLAKVFAGTFGASLHLVHIFEEQIVTGPMAGELYLPPQDTRLALLDDARTRLGQRLTAADRSRFHGTTDVVLGSSAAVAIVDYAREQQVDLIVLGTHGRTGVAHLLLGSVAERVVRTADCPVLTIRDTAPAGARATHTAAQSASPS